MRNKIIVDISLVIIISILFIDLIFAQVIPENRRVDWSNVGLEINRPEYYHHIIDVCQPPYNVVPNPNGDWNINVIGLRRAIDSARVKTGWKLLFFSQPGTYRFGGIIDLGVDDSNLVFKGIGSNNVILFFKASDEVLDMFRISGAIIETLNVTNEIFKNNNEITLQSGSLDTINHYIDFFDDRPTNYDWARVGQIFKVNSYLGNSRYKLSDNFSINHPLEYGPQIIKFLPAKNIGFEDITIQREGGISRGSNASCNIRFKYATNCWVYGVESWGTMGWHFGIEKSSHIWIHGNFLHHANNYAGGDAYGVAVHDRSTNCLIENNIFNYLRHSMLVQSSSTKNVFAYNYSYDKYCNADCNFLGDGSADISLHGTFTNSNLFEGNMAEFLKADRSHGFNGDFNTFFRNQIGTIGFLNDIEIEFIYSPNIIGNKCTELNHDLNVFSKLDFYGISNGINYPHNYYGDNRGNLDPTIYLPDYSYYLQNNPLWLIGYTWPPIGPRISTNDQYPTNIIPSLIRHLAGGKKTLDGPMVKTIVKLNPGYYPETNSYGGSYKINGNNTTTWYPLFNEQVTIQAFPQNSGEVFYEWSDGSTSNPRTIQIKNSLNINAFFKYPNKSSNANGYDKDGQKKIARGTDGGIWKVYESSGCVWIEKDGQVSNNGLAINEFSDGPEAKSPSLDYVIKSNYSTDIFVVYQQKTNNGKYKIKFAKFNESGQKIYSYDVLTSTFDYATFDATPVISVTRNQYNAGGKTKFNIVWRQKAEGSYQNGLYFYPGMDNGTNVSWYYLPPQKVSNSDALSSNPTVAAYKSSNGSVVILHHLAWQQGTTKIKYRALADKWNGSMSGGVTEFGNLEEPSSGSGSSINYEPSIALINTGTGSNYGLYSSDSPKLVWKGDYSVIHRSRTNSTSTGTWNTFYNYYANDDISAANINSALEEQSYVIVWAELQGYFNRYIKSTNLSAQILMTSIRGKDLQVSNYTALWDGVTINVFNNDYYHSSPYSFQPFNFYEGFSKQGNLISKEGRFGTVMKNEAEFYFGMGDITLDNNLINFKPSIDTLEIISNESLNSYLVSEPFQVNDNSSLTYTVFYGVKDSMEALSNLSNSESVSFKIELIDNSTNEVLGVFDEITQNNQNLVAYENISYQINTSGIGNRTVRLRLTVNENLSVPNYSLSKIYSDGGSLSKSKIKEVSWNGSLTVKEYSLVQNYPNPFNPRTNIKFQLPKSGFVTLKVYDILGKEITTLINEDKAQGQYEVNFDASSLASGVYIYTINAGDFNSTKKMILVK